MKVALRLSFLLFASCGPDSLDLASRTDELTQVTSFGSNPGGLSLFLHEPAGLPTGAPLVVALHGCTQSASAYSATGWNELADQNGFLVAYPQTTANNSCFNWFTAAQQSRTGAEVTSILQMVSHLVSTKGVNAQRVYVTGLSAGAAMSNVLLAVAPDVFTRGSVIAGLPFACATTQIEAFSCMSGPTNQTPAQWGALVRAVSGSNAPPRVQLWHGSSDTTVVPANLTEEVDQWTDVNGIDATAESTVTIGAATRRTFQNGSGVVLVESWSVSGMNHGTPVDPPLCGTAGAFILDVNLCSSRFAAEFFGLADGGFVPPVVDGGSLNDGGVVTDAGLPANCLGEWFDSNVNHFSAGRAVLCSGRYCAKGSMDLLGDSLDQVWVRQVSSTRWEAGRCASSGTGGGGGGSATGGGTATGGGSPTGGGSATGGGSPTGGGSASGGGAAQAGGGASGGGMTEPTGCGCSTEFPLSSPMLTVLGMAALSRRRRRSPVQCD